MNHRTTLLLLGLTTILLSGCASYDRSMASDAVDIPNDPPLSEEAPVITAPAPPSSAHAPIGRQVTEN